MPVESISATHIALTPPGPISSHQAGTAPVLNPDSRSLTHAS
jgi:hypothetical protein